MQETWKPIPGYEGYYDVSDYGSVRSHDRETTRVDGKRFSKRGRTLQLKQEARGYLSVRLCVETEHRIFKVHRLVALAFLPPAPSDSQINHKNGIKTDNRPENLEWVSASENVRHAFAMNLVGPRVGESNSRAILTSDDVRKIRLLSAEGISCAAISRRYAVSEGTIRQILKGRNWKHVG
ncbi:NUMOD4 domain-containing protein [uncultured Pseudomonas sp.]|uniref:NUMOD4 domain-containing protein n=1 Tax=uncultured Pseudomonas sp. TaxID=114707 RepID=UPI002587D42E|nr:NUMOD4 domain-containing protein [uncultured Pseudomonas sp.]